jgi:hypothetical protein
MKFTLIGIPEKLKLRLNYIIVFSLKQCRGQLMAPREFVSCLRNESLNYLAEKDVKIESRAT